MAGMKVETAKRNLVRFIREGELAVGDRLPSHAELRRRLGFSTETVHSAIRQLRDDGVLEVRDKVGVFVRDTQADGHIGGMVGIALYDVLCDSAFNNFLVNTVNVKLNSYGFMTRLFSVQERLLRPAYRMLEELPGLARGVRSREFDIVLSLVELNRLAAAELRESGIPLVTFATDPEPGNSLAIDYISFIEDAFLELMRRNCRRIGILYTEDTRAFIDDFARIRDRVAPEVEIMNLPASGEAFCSAWLGERVKEAPDGIVSVDDTLVMDLLLALLRRRQLDYQPWIVDIRNRQTSINFPWEKQIVYEIDLIRLADFIVDHVLTLLKSGHDWPRTHWFKINRMESHSTNKGGSP